MQINTSSLFVNLNGRPPALHDDLYYDKESLLQQFHTEAINRKFNQNIGSKEEKRMYWKLN